MGDGCAIVTLQASAHQAASITRRTAKQPAVSSEHLLEEAYLLGKEVPVEDRVWLLAELTMPAAMRREALEATVKNLTRGSGNKDDQNWRVRIYTSSGVAEFHARNAGLLFEVLPMVREVDPDWARRLVEQNHDLAQAETAQGKILNREAVVIYQNPDSAASPADLAAKEQWGLEMSRIGQIQDIVARDPDQALTLAMSIGDPGRQAMGVAYASAGFRNKPEQARQMPNQSQQTMSSLKGREEKLEILVGVAQSAASLDDFPLALQAVEKGLDLGEQVYEDSRKEHPDWPAYSWEGQDDMRKLSEIGARLDVVQVVGQIHAIQESLLQAYLLVSVSRGLDEGQVGVRGEGMGW